MLTDSGGYQVSPLPPSLIAHHIFLTLASSLPPSLPSPLRARRPPEIHRVEGTDAHG